LFIAACDLFTPLPEGDLQAKIEENVRWANAARLSVSVTFPLSWGRSPQEGNGKCRDNKRTNDTPRKGYEFNVEFTPDMAYTLTEWRVYHTSSLNALGNWLENQTLFTTQGLNPLGSDKVTYPEVDASGGIFTFTIHTTEPVTIVPWCKTQPRITRTEPRDSPDGPPYARGSDIVLYFNSALNEGTVKFANAENAAGIWITAESFDTGTVTVYDDWFTEPEYAAVAGLFTVTMHPNKMPPANSLITVTVRGIQNAQNEPMNDDPLFKFQWRTPTNDIAYLNSYRAECNDGSISVECTQTGADRVETYYRVNRGANIPFEGTIYDVQSPYSSFTGTIGGVQEPDDSGVREGRSVQGINEYEIFIELWKEGVPAPIETTRFKIWNIKGMIVTQGNTVLLDNSLNQTEMRNRLANAAYTNYALTSDIELSDWEPAGNSTTPFQGKFYGNGYTVTINSMMTSANCGLFGIVNGGLVRDLTVHYDSVTINHTGSITFGGIAGTTQGGAQFENVLVLGVVDVIGTGNVTSAIYIGGMVGLMTGTSSICNAYDGLNLTVENSYKAAGGIDNSLCVGGITGSMGKPGVGDPVTVENATAVGNITVGWVAAVNSFYDSDAVSGLFVGGLTGFIQGKGAGENRAKILNSDYRQGDIWIRGGIGTMKVGGAVGYIQSESTIIDCNAIPENFNTFKTGTGAQYYMGGFVGDIVDSVIGSSTVENCYSEGSITATPDVNVVITVVIGGFAGRVNGNISYCYAKGNVSSTVYGGSDLFSGGFMGILSGKVSFCYATGNVSATSMNTSGGSNATVVGGFAGINGFTSNSNIFDCYSTGDVFFDKKNGTNNAHVGGFVGRNRWSSSISGNINRCFATGSVFAHRSTAGNLDVGIIVGGFGSGSIQNSAALGASITVTGGSERPIGRVYGYSTDGTKQNNYAWDGMKLYESATYNGATSEITPTPGSNTQHGEDADMLDFVRPSFWYDTLNFNNVKAGFGGITNTWNFAGIEGRGYPLLNGPNGGLLGGQE